MGLGNSVEETKEDIDTGKECSNSEHAFQQIFKCDQLNCEQFCCRKCMGLQDNLGARFCVCCTVNIENSQVIASELTPGQGKVIEPFVRTLEVKRDKETGQVIGWDDFFAHIER